MIYIQCGSNGLPINHECSCAMHGAIESGIDFALVEYAEIGNGMYDNLIPFHTFVGTVEFMHKCFSRIERELSLGCPSNSNRKCKVMELHEAFEIAKSKPIFIKPVKMKLFTGLVLDGFRYAELESLPKSTMVMAYDPFRHDIESEYRCYIHRHRIEDIKNYSGDFRLLPNIAYIENQMKENRDSFPTAYTIDVAVLSDGNTVVVEYNDFYAIGNYGLPNKIYLRMLMDRYFEIVNSNLN